MKELYFAISTTSGACDGYPNNRFLHRVGCVWCKRVTFRALPEKAPEDRQMINALWIKIGGYAIGAVIAVLAYNWFVSRHQDIGYQKAVSEYQAELSRE